MIPLRLLFSFLRLLSGLFTTSLITIPPTNPPPTSTHKATTLLFRIPSIIPSSAHQPSPKILHPKNFTLTPKGELHGDMTQAARLESLEKFRAGTIAFLLATDVAARGLDISGVQVRVGAAVAASGSPRLRAWGLGDWKGKDGDWGWARFGGLP